MTIGDYGDEWVPRTIRVPRDLWDAARTIAVEHDDNLSRIIRASLMSYVAKEERKAAATGQTEAPPKRSR